MNLSGEELKLAEVQQVNYSETNFEIFLLLLTLFDYIYILIRPFGAALVKELHARQRWLLQVIYRLLFGFLFSFCTDAVNTAGRFSSLPIIDADLVYLRVHFKTPLGADRPHL